MATLSVYKHHFGSYQLQIAIYFYSLQFKNFLMWPTHTNYEWTKTVKFSLFVQSTMPFKTSSNRLCKLKLLDSILKFLLNSFSSSITSLHSTNDRKNENPLTITKWSKLNTLPRSKCPAYTFDNSLHNAFCNSCKFFF